MCRVLRVRSWEGAREMLGSKLWMERFEEVWKKLSIEAIVKT
jgi:hypothetical protein